MKENSLNSSIGTFFYHTMLLKIRKCEKIQVFNKLERLEKNPIRIPYLKERDQKRQKGLQPQF